MKSSISFILNLPFTLIGLILAMIAISYKIKILKNPIAIVFKVKSFWWTFGYFKKARAITIGNVIMLSPKELKNDYKHEIIHVRQYERYPFIFPIFYYYEMVKRGYRMNRFEDEAYIKSKSFYNGVQQGI